MHLNPDVDRKVRRVSGPDAEALVDRGVLVLDVRTPDEFTGLGHIPGAALLPVQLAASAPAMLAHDDRPVLVCCEHAVRSRFAAQLLVQAGFTEVFELAYGMAAWDGPRAFEAAPIFGPAEWIVENSDLLPQGGRTLDVACGAGRHALLLASAGFDVVAIDRNAAALDRLGQQAERLGITLRTLPLDLEQSIVDLGESAYDLIVVTRYLHRPLFPALVRALAPGGTLVYETFIEAQAERGHPTNPDFLLKPGELSTLVQPLTVVRAREGDFDGALVSGVVARTSAS